MCIAALCREGDETFAVVGADRMVTLGGFIEFEHTVPKMAHPAPHAVVMIAGDTLTGTRLANSVVTDLRGGMPRIDEIAERLSNRYGEFRRSALDAQILALRGLDLGSFYGAHGSLQQPLVMMLDNQMAQFNLSVELLLAGVDEDGAHIYSVHNPGDPSQQHDVIGYAAIGIGTLHALQSMIGFRHGPTAGLRETIFRVYASKRRAEVAPGVGADTDMAIISTSTVTFLQESLLKRLSNMYDNYGRGAEEAQVKELAELNLDELASDGEGGANG